MFVDKILRQRRRPLCQGSDVQCSDPWRSYHRTVRKVWQQTPSDGPQQKMCLAAVEVKYPASGVEEKAFFAAVGDL
jgi:hypothetical protein